MVSVLFVTQEPKLLFEIRFNWVISLDISFSTVKIPDYSMDFVCAQIV